MERNRRIFEDYKCRVEMTGKIGQLKGILEWFPLGDFLNGA